MVKRFLTTEQIDATYGIDEIEKKIKDVYERELERLWDFIVRQGISSKKHVFNLGRTLRRSVYFLTLGFNQRMDIQRKIITANKVHNETWLQLLNAIYKDQQFLIYILPIKFRKNWKEFAETFEDRKEGLKSTLESWKYETRAGHLKMLIFEIAPCFWYLAGLEFGQSKQVEFVYNLLLEYDFEWKRGKKCSDYAATVIKDRIRVEFQQYAMNFAKEFIKEYPGIQIKKDGEVDYLTKYSYNFLRYLLYGYLLHST